MVTIAVDDPKLLDYSFSFLTQFEQRFSRFLPTSDVSYLNSRIGKITKVRDAMRLALRQGMRYMSETSGYFSIFVKERLEQLGYDADYTFKEKDIEVRQLRIPMLRFGNYVYLRQQIDLGGFGKGYALDLLAASLIRKGATDFVLEAGGDVYANGMQKILLEDPLDASKSIGSVMIQGSAIASSSASKRSWGKKLHHLINPKTGMPAEGVLQVYVLADKTADADAYATALFAAGFEDAKRLAKALKLSVVIISSAGKIFHKGPFVLTK